MSKFGVAILPFLKTSAPVRMGRYLFRSTTDLEGLDEEEAAAVTELTSMLYLRDDLRIARAIYALVEPIGVMRPGPVIDRLERIRSVIGYLYSAPHPTFGSVFLPFENASLLIVEPTDVSIYLLRPQHGIIDPASPVDLTQDRLSRVRGYEGVFNHQEPLWLTLGSRIYGPKHQITLNIAQDFIHDIEEIDLESRPGLRMLFSLLDASASPLSERIFTALDWYNDASTTFGDLGKCLLSLAIAFETLLQLPESEKTERLVDAISLLLGRTERLSEWARQFYTARSQVAHEGRIRDWRFYTQGRPKNNSVATAHSFGSVMTYGRQIFRLCLETVLTGAALAEQAGLREKFIANGERYAAIARALNEGAGAPEVRLASIEPLVAALHEYRFVGGSLTLEGVLTAVNAGARKLLELEPQPLENVVQVALRKFTELSPKDLGESLAALERVREALSPSAPDTLARHQSVGVVASLIDIAWQTLAPTYFHLTDVRALSTPGTG